MARDSVVRMTSIGRLQHVDVPANYVAQLSSHKNLQSGFTQICIFTSPAENVTRTEPLRARGMHHQHHNKQRACNIYSIWHHNQTQCFDFSSKHSRSSISHVSILWGYNWKHRRLFFHFRKPRKRHILAMIQILNEKHFSLDFCTNVCMWY